MIPSEQGVPTPRVRWSSPSRPPAQAPPSRASPTAGRRGGPGHESSPPGDDSTTSRRRDHATPWWSWGPVRPRSSSSAPLTPTPTPDPHHATPRTRPERRAARATDGGPRVIEHRRDGRRVPVPGERVPGERALVRPTGVLQSSRPRRPTRHRRPVLPALRSGAVGLPSLGSGQGVSNPPGASRTPWRRRSLTSAPPWARAATAPRP
jgi:hypothetical protein